MHQTWCLAETPEAAAAREAHNKKTVHQPARAALELAQAASQPNASIEILSAGGLATVDVTILEPIDERPKHENMRMTRLNHMKRYACAHRAPRADAAPCVSGAPRLAAHWRLGSCHTDQRASHTNSRFGLSSHSLTCRIALPSPRRSASSLLASSKDLVPSLVNDALSFVRRKRVSAARTRPYSRDPRRALSLSSCRVAARVADRVAPV